MTAHITFHDLTAVKAHRLATDDGLQDCSNITMTARDGSYVTIFMPFDLAEAMAAAYATAQTPDYQALVGFAEDVRDCSPDVICGRASDPQDDVSDMIAADVLWDFQADAEKLIGKRQKAVAA